MNSPTARPGDPRRPNPAAGRDPYAVPEIVPATEAPAPTIGPATAPADRVDWAGTRPAATGGVAPVAPVAPSPRAVGRRPRVRRVTRVIRHVDPWSAFKVGLLFSVVGYLVVLTSGVLLWRVADATGTLANVERWFTQFGWETFEFSGEEIFRNAWTLGLFGVVLATGVIVLLATLFNLVSDIVGGVRVTVLEEEVVERTVSSTRRYVVRRPPSEVDTGVPAAWSVDDGSVEAARTAAHRPPPTQDWSVDDDPPGSADRSSRRPGG